jgi:23S rRNA pseudouridine1911/1915/1917 synthase
VSGKRNKNNENRVAGFTVHADLPSAARGLGSAMHCVGHFKPFRSNRMVRQGLVSVNNKVVRDVRRRLEVGDRVEWQDLRPKRDQSTGPPKPPPIHRKTPLPAIYYRDEHIAVVFKPSGLLTVPTPRGERKTLMHWLANQLKVGRNRPEIRPVQRLDRAVSGVLVFAISELAYNSLRGQFEKHSPDRRYLAIVAGRPKPEQGTFSSMMATQRNLKRYSLESKGFGERAITHYRVLQQTPSAALVEVWLETGKRHQIRVHFSEAGNPILGDEQYQRRRAKQTDWHADRIALHAATLGFEHPVTGEHLEFTSAPPYEFNDFLEAQQPSASKAVSPVLNTEKPKEGQAKQPTRKSRPPTRSAGSKNTKGKRRRS